MLNLFVGMIINNFSFVHESGDVLVTQVTFAARIDLDGVARIDLKGAARIDFENRGFTFRA